MFYISFEANLISTARVMANHANIVLHSISLAALFIFKSDIQVKGILDLSAVLISGLQYRVQTISQLAIDQHCMTLTGAQNLNNNNNE